MSHDGVWSVDRKFNSSFIPDALKLLTKHYDILSIAKYIVDFSNTGFIYTCGNGGSSATASHFTSDLFAKGIDSFCLNDNTSVLSSIANDYDYSKIFSMQLENSATDWDLLLVISCSGNSKNIIEAIKYANSINMFTIAFTSFDGGEVSKLADEVIHIPTNNIYLAEGIHSLLLHDIINML